MPIFLLVLLFSLIPTTASAGWKPLFNGRNLDGWELRGPCAWTVMDNGVLLGQRVHKSLENPLPFPIQKEKYTDWLWAQAWLYTVREFDEYDLELEYWLPKQANSGISIRDRSRAHHAIREPDSERPDLASYPKTTPAHIGYEIQLTDNDRDPNPSGSLYGVAKAKSGAQRQGWNKMRVESRRDRIRVTLNGQLVMESAGDPKRPKTGPIGLQLHDQFSFMMFRNIRIREITPAK